MKRLEEDIRENFCYFVMSKDSLEREDTEEYSS